MYLYYHVTFLRGLELWVVCVRQCNAYYGKYEDVKFYIITVHKFDDIWRISISPHLDLSPKVFTSNIKSYLYVLLMCQFPMFMRGF